MSKHSLLLAVADDLRRLADSLQAVAGIESDKPDAQNDSSPAFAPLPIPAPETSPVTLEQVRAVLADKSQDGKLAEVRALISKYGAKKLSEVDPKHYAALLADAKEL